MDDVCPESVDRPLLVCGMHRSGTSLTASLFHAAGVRLGDRLLGANVGNDRGHFEDLDVYEFHQAALRSNGLGTEGYLAAGSVVVPEPLEPIGRRLAADRARGGGVWGWKEPRTVLFLDYWDAILPAARYVFVFRRPWEVVDSLFRRGDETFAGNPAFAAEVWLHYNRTILEFARRHRERCLVVEVDCVAADPRGVFAAVRSQLGIALADPPELFEPRLLVGDGDPGHALAIRACLPEAEEVYRELRSLAGADPVSEAVAADVDRAAVGRRLLGEWRRTRRAEAQVAELLPQLTWAREAAATAEAAVATLRGSLADLEGAGHRLDAVRTEQTARIAALEAERAAVAGTATAVQSLEREIAALRDELHEREAVLKWTADRLRSREGSVLRRIRREGRRIAAQAAAALRRICGRKPATAAESDPRSGHRDAA
jgi:hypothetical protein